VIECLLRVLPGRRHPDFVQRCFRFRLLALGQLVQDVGRFVHPAALRPRRAAHLRQGFPEPQRAIAHRHMGIDLQAARLEPQQQFPPGSLALPVAVG